MFLSFYTQFFWFLTIDFYFRMFFIVSKLNVLETQLNKTVNTLNYIIHYMNINKPTKSRTARAADAELAVSELATDDGCGSGRLSSGKDRGELEKHSPSFRVYPDAHARHFFVFRSQLLHPGMNSHVYALKTKFCDV